MCRSRIIQYTARHTSYHATTHNQVTSTSRLCSCHSIHLACCLRLVVSVPPLMLMGSLNWRACFCAGKVGTVLPKVAFLATVVAPTITLYTRAGTPQMRAPTYVALHSTLLGRKTTKPLRLMRRSVIRPPPLVMSRLGPIWSTNPLRLLRPLTLYLILHLLHYFGLLY